MKYSLWAPHQTPNQVHLGGARGRAWDGLLFNCSDFAIHYWSWNWLDPWFALQWVLTHGFRIREPVQVPQPTFILQTCVVSTDQSIKTHRQLLTVDHVDDFIFWVNYCVNFWMDMPTYSHMYCNVVHQSFKAFSFISLLVLCEVKVSVTCEMWDETSHNPSISLRWGNRYLKTVVVIWNRQQK